MPVYEGFSVAELTNNCTKSVLSCAETLDEKNEKISQRQKSTRLFKSEVVHRVYTDRKDKVSPKNFPNLTPRHPQKQTPYLYAKPPLTDHYYHRNRRNHPDGPFVEPFLHHWSY